MDKMLNPLSINSNIWDRLERCAAQEGVSAETLVGRWLDANSAYPKADLLQQIFDVVIATDRNLLITEWNKAAEYIYGWTAAEALGQQVDDLLKTEWIADTQAQAETTLVATGLWRGEVRQQTKAGQHRFIWASVGWMRNSQGEIVGGITVNRDITEQKSAEEALRRQNHYLTVLHQITLELLNNRNTPALLQSIVDHAAAIMDAAYAEIMFREGDELVVQTCTANQPFLIGDRARRGEALLAWQAYDTRQVVTIEDYATFAARRPIYDTESFHAVACFPIMVGQTCLGVLDLSRNVPDYPFTAEQIQQGVLFAQLVALLLDNTHLYEAAAREIDQRSQTEETLRQSELRYRSMFENNLAVKLVINSETGRIVDANTAAADFYGYSPDQLKSMRIQDINTLTDAEIKAEMALARSEDRKVFHFRHRLASGEIRDVEVYSGPVAVENTKLLFSIILDVTERKRAEDALRQSEERFRTVADWTYDWEYWISPERDVLYMSPSVERVTGYPVSAFVADPTLLSQIVHPDDRAVWDQHQTVLDDEVSCRHSEVELEFRVIVQDGSVRWIHHICRPVFDQHGNFSGRRVSNRETTKRKQAEEALQASEARLRSLVESQTTYLVRTDMNGRYSYANEAFFRKFCWRYAHIDDLIGMSSLQTIIREDHKQTLEIVNACIQHPSKPMQVILRKPAPNDGIFWTLWEFVGLADAEGAVYEIQCVGIDITELTLARQQLQLQENALQAAANAIVIANRQGIIEWTNPAFTTLTGYTAEETRGSRTNLLKSGMQDAQIYESLWKTILSGQVWRGRLINKRKDGSLYTEEQTITPVRDDDGMIRHFVAIKQDVTEREQAEQIRLERERLKASLSKEQEFNTLVQKAVSALSHDVRTPLAAISIARDLLDHYHDRLTEGQRREKLDSIKWQLRYVVQLMNDLSLAVKGILDQGAFQPALMNVATLCQVTVSELQQTFGSKHQLRFSTDGSIQTALVDETLLSRILLNLLSNAVKFSPEGSEIMLELNRRENWMVLRVVDQGMGISEDDQQHIFEPFYRAKAARTIAGTGLGLNIVKDCVVRHQGQVNVESHPGRGTTFTVEVPLVEHSASISGESKDAAGR